MEVREGVVVFVSRRDELILGVLDSVTDVEGVFDTDEEALTVLVLYTVLETTILFDTLTVLVDVLLCNVDLVSVTELEGVLDCFVDIVSDNEQSGEDDSFTDILKVGVTELNIDFVIEGLAEELIVLL